MLAQRVSQQSTRRFLLAQQPTLSRFTPPAAIAATRLRPQARYVLNRHLLPQPYRETPLLRPSFLTTRRLTTPSRTDAANMFRKQLRHVAFQPSATEPTAQTQPAKPADEYAILVAQRRNRPISPHLSVYQPQITWYASGLNRITGSVLSGGLYIFGAAYLVSPLLGWHLESATMAEWFGGFGAVSKGVMKFGISWPFTFHAWNGIRHLTWDTGRELGNRQVQVTGWIVVALSVVSSTVLAFVGTGGGKKKGKEEGDEGWKSEFKNWKG